MTTPALMAVRASFPTAEITVLANPLVSQLFACHPAVDRVISFDRQGQHSGVTGRLRLACRLRREHFDLAVILPNSFDSALVPWLAGIPQRLGKASDGRSLLLTGRYIEPVRQQPLHEVQYYLELLRHFGISGPECEPCLCTTGQEDDWVAALLAERGIGDGPLIGINAGASFGSAKRWYPERFAEVAQQLSAEWNAQVVLFGGPDEQPLVAEIERGLQGQCLNLAGKTTVRELMALIKRCNLLVTNDSGPMHIAAAFGVPLVAIFGPTDHVGTAPYTEKAVVVRTETSCAPCKLRVCPTDHSCMTAVTVDQVLAAAKGLLRGKI